MVSRIFCYVQFRNTRDIVTYIVTLVQFWQCNVLGNGINGAFLIFIFLVKLKWSRPKMGRTRAILRIFVTFNIDNLEMERWHFVWANARLGVKKGRFGLTYKSSKILKRRERKSLFFLFGRESLLSVSDRTAFAFICCICNVCDKLWKNHYRSQKWFQKWKTIENFGHFSPHSTLYFNQYIYCK